ncbi:uncharacterized protein LOC106876168 [Octopus bimaculoides]|uniref:Uncharacterized protein n=1 Tax=Octopus bimaculoides TaxID=37653 RepID=A0A0L8GKZ0_OCTBM|nr:uncharacterized protein LOC106876168 [Octopus bimaculoides]|eukprot:XP_014780085.1 PREDICTED: uncharacterized protein LOC106876168 [Octopus bimaculoides]
MKILSICFILSLALILGVCDNTSLPVKSIPAGVYITTTLDNLDIFTALEKIKNFCAGGNSLQNHFHCKGLIVQGERRNPAIGGLKWKYVFSMPLDFVNLTNLPLPNDRSLKLDFHLGTPKSISEKCFSKPIPVGQVYQKLIEVYNQTQNTLQKNWFYMTGFKNLETSPTFSKLWFDKSPYFTRRKPAPDDSNILSLCSGNSGYNCPNTTYCFKDNIETRKMSMYIVTGEAKDYAEQNCSYNTAVMDQYMNNHRYFRGRNSLNLTMSRTIPVMTKITKQPAQSTCPQKYQMQFYVHKEPPPCPTNSNVLLELLTDMEVYVKAFYGYANNAMDFLYQHFSQELTSKQRSYVTDQYYLSVFRGHGPAFGRRIEIWILKNPLACSRQCN